MLSSPCINLCKMDPASGLCQGCFRTLEEITAWARSDEERQAEILTAVAARRALFVRQKPPGGAHEH